MWKISSTSTQLNSFSMYRDHGSLYDLLHNETVVIESELLVPILRDISQGMRFLHSSDIIHGDLKAANILVDSKFRAKGKWGSYSISFTLARHLHNLLLPLSFQVADFGLTVSFLRAVLDTVDSIRAGSHFAALIFIS
jgi:serine/threonine protein kinase